MKVLILSDYLGVCSIFKSQNDRYFYNSIQIDYIFLRNMEDLKDVCGLLESFRYHLLLCLTESEYQGQYVALDQWINSVNNYGSDEMRKYCEENYRTSKGVPINIVNSSTAYFNVFLPIQKGVSWTGKSPDSTLKRLDSVSSWNFLLAYLLSTHQTQYYILNYRIKPDLKNLESLLLKIE